MNKIKKLSLPVKGIFLLIALFFSFGIYLSIPVLFNYKSIESIIEDKFYSDFNINLNINGDIKYQLLPKPHLLIKDSYLSINENESMSLDIEKLKVFLNSNSLYPKSKVNFEKLEIHNSNFLLKKKEYKLLRNYLHTSESKPIHIFKSKIFVLDEQDETIIISPIEKINFITSKKDNLKKLNIKGNIFDIDFKLLWKKDFNSKMNSELEMNLRNPNILIKNKLNFNNSKNLDGSTFLNFLNKNIEINYKLEDDLINIKSPDNNNDIKINAKIELKPFYFNSNLILNKQNLNIFVDELLLNLLNLKPDLLGNLNGYLKLSLNKIQHELISSGEIKFFISQQNINLTEVLFNLGEIGIIESKIKYDKQNGDIIFKSSNLLLIKDKKKFAKKFQVKLDKVKNLNKIFFKIEKNINTGLTSIFDIKFDQIEYEVNKRINLKYKIKNSQELKSLVKKIINN